MDFYQLADQLHRELEELERKYPGITKHRLNRIEALNQAMEELAQAFVDFGRQMTKDMVPVYEVLNSIFYNYKEIIPWYWRIWYQIVDFIDGAWDEIKNYSLSRSK